MEVNQLTDGVLELSLCEDSSDMEIDLIEVDNDPHNHSIQTTNKEDVSTITDEHQKLCSHVAFKPVSIEYSLLVS